ncbi:hypothetical protein FisN_14Hu015 [Fistulifera solaris]|uniref:Uncharacterized protein n=1 Tax=Fistulifera solaris TaxID=1519565 RepID=A0A1Z5K8C4_FISSO|nr:hypothetical protein FisN_14Hu015 [Fistulifera solaris]|eukprot:GAX22402.1 hypothetical protein FisN_14Hu015 [Fistulifera solaris]
MGKSLGKILVFALVGLSTALFDRHLQICNRGGRGVSCDCVAPVGKGNCLDASQKAYNRCVKADNTLTLQKCKERAESISNQKLRGIVFADFKDNRACSILFDVGVDLENNCPTDFNKVTGFLGSGRVNSADNSSAEITCCRCE